MDRKETSDMDSMKQSLVSATPRPFIMAEGVRIVDRLDSCIDYPYLKRTPEDFPFGDATPEHYNMYHPPVLLHAPEQQERFIYCIGHNRLYVSKHIKVYQLKTKYLLKYRQWEERDTYSLPSGYALSGGRYIIRKKLGNGYFGITYLADIHAPGSPDHGQPIAIKELYLRNLCYRKNGTGHVEFTKNKENDRFVQIARKKFEGEITKNQLCNSHHIVHIKSMFEENNTLYYTMEYVSGKTLDELLDNGYILTEEEAMHHVRETALALKEMHTNQLLHLDIKPSNILVRDDGGTVLIDFGATKQFDDYGLPCSGNPLICTRGFESPEVQRGRLTTFLPQADVYSLGMTFYYLLTQSLPQNRREMKHKLKSYNSAIRNAIELAIHYDNRKRLMTIDEFISILDGHEPSQQHPDTEPVTIRPPYERQESGFF